MDISIVEKILGTYGFPIAVCLVCFWFINKLIQEHRQERQTDRETAASERKELTTIVSKNTESINNNTLVIQRLIDRLGGGKDENQS